MDLAHQTLLPLCALLLSTGFTASAQPTDPLPQLCPLDLERDYLVFQRDYLRQAKAALDASMSLIGQDDPLSFNQGRERVRTAMERGLDLAKTFRRRHPGTYSCALHQPIERQTILDIVAVGEQSNRMRGY